MEKQNWLHLSHQEYEDIYSKIVKKLKEPFPEGTVKKKNKSDKSAFIPVQAYVNKLNDAAGGYYKWQITTLSPIIHFEQRLLEMRGTLSILNTSNEGQGFQDFNFVNGTQKINNYDEVIRGAVRRALVNALDMYEAGWVDLAQYREWGDNPALGLKESDGNDDGQPSNPPCVNCGKTLTDKELAAINETKWSYNYCDTHLPDFVRKKLPKGWEGKV